MGTKLFLAILVVLVGLMIVPLFNEVLSDLVEVHLISRWGWLPDDYRTAFWRFFPIIIGGYLLVILPIQILASGGVQKFLRGRRDDDEQ